MFNLLPLLMLSAVGSLCHNLLLNEALQVLSVTILLFREVL